jgi:hypothetical protein
MIESIQSWHWSSAKELGAASVAIMVVGYAIYIRQTYLNKVRPHPLSWVLFASTTGVAYLIQVSRGGGPGSWVMGLTAFVCFAISALSWYMGRRLSYSSRDWIFFAGALLVLGCYVATVHVYKATPAIPAVVATIADVVAYVPTVVKGWSKPHDDSVTSFLFNSAKFLPSVAALGPYTLATHLFPVTLGIVNALVAAMLVLRRLYLGGAHIKAHSL